MPYDNYKDGVKSSPIDSGNSNVSLMQKMCIELMFQDKDKPKKSNLELFDDFGTDVGRTTYSKQYSPKNVVDHSGYEQERCETTYVFSKQDYQPQPLLEFRKPGIQPISMVKELPPEETANFDIILNQNYQSGLYSEEPKTQY